MESDFSDRISSAFVNKLVKTVEEMDIYIEEVTIEGIAEDMAELVKSAMADDEVRAIMRKKIIETISHIDAKEAAKTVTLSWGELIGQFMAKVAQAFTSKKN